MSAAGQFLRSATGTGEKRLLHWCPGCKEPHGIRITGGPPVWTFNGDYAAPSFQPSVLCFTGYDDEGEPLPKGQRRTLCHYFIRRGSEIPPERARGLDPTRSYIDFCGDSPHELSGKIVPLPPWPYERGAFGGIEEPIVQPCGPRNEGGSDG